MRKALLLAFAFAFMLVNWAVAQDRTISGTVTDGADGSPLPGVNVVVKGTTSGTITDASGVYQISVAQGAVLVFSYVGYLPKEMTVGAESKMDVALAADSKILEEIVVVGYSAVPKRSVTGSVSAVRAAEIENLPMQSFDKAMQGRAAGVLVQSNNGIPGGAISVRIRGTGSITAGNDPLYIVDGVQMNVRNDAGFTQSNPLAFLNPNDIASIDILKDAATAAIYGAQAANGVVIITTKRGKAGKSKISLNYYTGINQPMRYLDVLTGSEWYSLRKEARTNSGNTIVEARTLSDMGVLPADYQSMTVEQLDAIGANLPTYDWQKEAFQDSKNSNYELSVSGGDDKTTFYISGSYSKQDAILRPVNFQRATLSTRLSHKVNNKLSIEQSLNLSTFEQNTPFAVSGSFLGSPAFATSAVLPHNPIYNEDGSYNTTIYGVLGQNAIAVLEQNSGKQRTNQAVGNMTVNYAIMDGLSFRSLWGMDYRIVQGESYRDPRTPDGFGVGGRGSVESVWNVNFISTQTLNYTKSIAETHNISAVAGIEYRSETNEGLSGSAIGFPTYQFRTIQSAATPESISGFWTGYRRFGTFAQANYDYKKKYLATATFRYDGSSRFGVENRFGFFPSVALAWVAKEESFLRDVNFLSDLKLRASFGQTGNDQIGNFASRGLYGGAGNYNGSAGIRPSSLGNAGLSWEINETVNLGLDFAFFKSRLHGSVDLFQRTSKNLLLSQPVLWTSGYDGLTTNVGSLVNKGVELELGGVLFDKSGFKWTSSFNFTYVHNEVTKLYGGLAELPGDPSIRVGSSLGTWFTQRYAGVNPALGRPMWYDINNNITYQPTAADRVALGSTLPSYYGGLNNVISYKGFELTIFFQYEYGRVVRDAQVGFLRENGTRLTLNALRETAEARWTTPGQITHIARPVVSNVETRGANPNGGDSYLQKSDYIRLKQATLAYNLRPALLSKIGISNAKVYIQGINLWTYADYTGYDPEWVDTTNNGSGLIPQSKSYTFGVQLSF